LRERAYRLRVPRTSATKQGQGVDPRIADAARCACGYPPGSKPVRTRLSVCQRKTRFTSEAEALVVVRKADIPLRPYLCDRCRKFHLTGRTKGKWVPNVTI